MTTETDRSVEVLHALNRIGAINLDVLLGQADKVQGALKESGIDVEPGDVCYRFSVHIGPRLVDIVSVAAEVERLGFTLSRVEQ